MSNPGPGFKDSNTSQFVDSVKQLREEQKQTAEDQAVRQQAIARTEKILGMKFADMSDAQKSIADVMEKRIRGDVYTKRSVYNPSMGPATGRFSIDT
ncbi:MAG: hypothetical protein ACEQSB_06285, partial [Undibacterium sp.]